MEQLSLELDPPFDPNYEPGLWDFVRRLYPMEPTDEFRKSSRMWLVHGPGPELRPWETADA